MPFCAGRAAYGRFLGQSKNNLTPPSNHKLLALVRKLLHGVKQDVENYYQDPELRATLTTIHRRAEMLLDFLQTFEDSNLTYPYLIFLTISSTIFLLISSILFFYWLFKKLRSRKENLPISPIPSTDLPTNLSSLTQTSVSPVLVNSPTNMAAAAALNRMRIYNT